MSDDIAALRKTIEEFGKAGSAVSAETESLAALKERLEKAENEAKKAK